MDENHEKYSLNCEDKQLNFEKELRQVLINQIIAYLKDCPSNKLRTIHIYVKHFLRK